MMRVLLFFGIILVCCQHCYTFDFSNLVKLMNKAKEEWDKFKIEMKLEYDDVMEETKRFRIFSDNLIRVMHHNLRYSMGKENYKLAVNKFSILDKKEISNLKCLNLAPRLKKAISQWNIHTFGSSYLTPNISMELPDNVDWREKGAVTPVKNQGHCGSCWAFSTTGSVEGQWFRKTGNLVSLSEQQLVDCAGGMYHNNGCNGGTMDSAFEYVKLVGGLDSEKNYPYESGRTQHKHDYCMYMRSKVVAKVTGFIDIPQFDEEKLKEAVAMHGPVSVAIDANVFSFTHYHSGIYDDQLCKGDPRSLDHGVLVVGYGTTETGVDYWIVKNSWSPSWGDQGYIRIRRNAGNLCGVATLASYPLV